jgi:hypothetical protein
METPNTSSQAVTLLACLYSVRYLTVVFIIPGVLNVLQTWGHIHRLLSTRGPQGYKRGQFVETPLKYIKTSYVSN